MIIVKKSASAALCVSVIIVLGLGLWSNGTNRSESHLGGHHRLTIDTRIFLLSYHIKRAALRSCPFIIIRGILYFAD